MFLSKLEQILTAYKALEKFGVPPRSDHRDAGKERMERKLEADLIVALSRGAMRHVHAPDLLGDFNLAAGNAGPSKGRAEHVPVLIHGIGLFQQTNQYIASQPHRLPTALPERSTSGRERPQR